MCTGGGLMCTGGLCPTAYCCCCCCCASSCAKGGGGGIVADGPKCGETSPVAAVAEEAAVAGGAAAAAEPPPPGTDCVREGGSMVSVFVAAVKSEEGPRREKANLAPPNGHPSPPA